MLSALGVTWTTTQALLIPLFRKHLSEPSLLLAAACSLTAGRLTLAVAYTVPLLMVGELLVVTGAATCFTIVTSLLSQAAPPQHLGAAMGAAAAVESLCGIVAPPVVGWLTSEAGGNWGDMAGALLAAGSNGFAAGLILALFRVFLEISEPAAGAKTKRAPTKQREQENLTSDSGDDLARNRRRGWCQ
eukprot:SAG22_NODE_2559_length_2444_cov_1.907036_2_plen_188_part_00